MRRKTGLLSRLFSRAGRNRPGTTAPHRALALEHLEPRTLLAGITVSGTVKIDNGIPLRGAMVDLVIPVYYTNLQTGAKYQTTLSGLAEDVGTNGSGNYTVTDDSSPGPGYSPYQLDWAGGLVVKFTAYTGSAGSTSYCVTQTGAPYWYPAYVIVPNGSGDTAVANAVLTFDSNSIGQLQRDAFDAFTTIYTYVTFMGNLGISGKPLAVVLSRSLTHDGFDSETDTIRLKPSDFEADGENLGHELGHWAAYSAGWFVPLGGEHEFLNNQRFAPEPSPTNYITAADQEFAFDEGFADWFATSGAANTPNVSVLSPLPGFASGTLRVLDGYNLTQPGGGGEDEELSIARILTRLESDPACGSYKAVYAAAAASGDTLYGFWGVVTTPIYTNQAALNRVARLAEGNNVAPIPNIGQTTITQAGATFYFYLPVTSPTQRITFDTVTLVLHDANGGVALNQTFQVSNGPTGVWINTDSGLAYDDPQDPVDLRPGRGAVCGVHWTVPAAAWTAAVADLNANINPTGGQCYWRVLRRHQHLGYRKWHCCRAQLLRCCRVHLLRQRARFPRLERADPDSEVLPCHQPRQQHARSGLQHLHARHGPGRNARVHDRHPLRLRQRPVRRPE